MNKKVGKYVNTTPIDDAFIDQSMIEYYENRTILDVEKHERFIGALESCLNNISEQLVELRRLSDTDIYEYKPKEIAAAFDMIENELKTAKTAYLLEGTNISLYQHRQDHQDRPIICLETREVFTSIPKAAKYTGINGGNISSAVHGKLKTAGGYHWDYYTPVRGYVPTNEFKKTWGPKKIIDSSDGTIYQGVTDAAKKTKLPEDIIFEAIMNNKPYAGSPEKNEHVIIYIYVNNHAFQRIVE